MRQRFLIWPFLFLYIKRGHSLSLVKYSLINKLVDLRDRTAENNAT